MAVRKYLSAQCRTSRGGVSDIQVLDLSEVGCLIDKRMISMQQGDRVLIKLEGLAYLPATVLWIEEGEAGLSFEQPIYGPVLEHVRRGFIVEKLD
jgi:hypothetical protein